METRQFGLADSTNDPVRMMAGKRKVGIVGYGNLGICDYFYINHE